MIYDEVIEHLKKNGDPRALEAWKRMGLPFENYFGNNLTKIKALSKKVKKNHDLALRLWESNIHDARLLATYIADPKLADEKLIDAWMKDIKSLDLSDKLCENVIVKMPIWKKKIDEWVGSKKELEKRSGYYLLYLKARKAGDFEGNDLEPYLERLEKEIRKAPNWAMEAMNLALIGIGTNSDTLRKKAVAAAKRIGKIEIDYGDTSCKNPDALEVLTKKK